MLQGKTESSSGLSVECPRPRVADKVTEDYVVTKGDTQPLPRPNVNDRGEQTSRRKSRPNLRCGRPHGGYMVVFACFVANFFVVGIGYSSGLYYLEWMDYFEEHTSSEISWVGSINLGLLGLAGPVGAILTTRFGDRIVLIVSSVVASLGIVSSAFVSNIYLMMVTFGVVTGLGFSISYVSTATVPMYFFDERRGGLALGIALSGGSCGAFFLPMLIGKLVDVYGWRGSLLILGGLHLNGCVCGALLRPPKRLQDKSRRGPIFNVKIFHDVSFVSYLIAQILISMSVSAVYMHVAALVETTAKVTRDKSGIILSVIGIFNFLGRILHGALTGIKSVDVFSQYAISFVIITAALFILPNVPSYTFGVIFGAVFGFCIAPFMSLGQYILVQLVGLENLKVAFGAHIFMSGIGLMTGAPIAGLLFDLTGDYSMSMYFGGATMIGGVLFLIKPWIDASCRKKSLRRNHELVEAETAVERESLTSVNGKVVNNE